MSARKSNLSTISLGLLLAWLLGAAGLPAAAQDEATDENSVVLSQLGELIDFARDVQPIFEAKCLVCHGPDEAKNDFRVDDSETVLAYIEAEDLESSSIWTDYLVTDDAEMRMPPPSTDKVAPLTGTELATLKLWIEEGAHWPDSDEPAIAAAPAEPLTENEKIWIFQGLFHPASVHFPIALLTVSAGFVLLSFLSKKSFEPVAFHCLWIGALGAIASCVMGWSYATYEGYGSGFSFDLQNSAIDRHRWLGVLVAVIAVILVPLARSVRRTGDTGMRLLWLLGSAAAVLAVSVAGYQGGELTYGEDHYLNEYRRLFPVAEEPTENGESVTAENDEAESSAAEADDSDADMEADAESPPEGDSDVSEENPPGEAADAEPPANGEATTTDTTGEVSADAPAADAETQPANEANETPPPVVAPSQPDGN